MAVLCCVVAAGCGRPAEPPFNFGTGPNARRDVGHGEPGQQRVFHYPALSLTSFATIDPATGTMRTEEIDGRWFVEYGYTNNAEAFSEVPLVITIYTNRNGRPGALINTYYLTSNNTDSTVRYSNNPGGTVHAGRGETYRDINPAYFHVSVLPSVAVTTTR